MKQQRYGKCSLCGELMELRDTKPQMAADGWDVSDMPDNGALLGTHCGWEHLFFNHQTLTKEEEDHA